MVLGMTNSVRHDMKDHFGVSREMTKEEKLRIEYPELLEKYLLLHEETLELNHLKSMNKDFSYIDKILGRELYTDYLDEVIKQERITNELKSEYEFLKKLVWEY